MRKICFAVVNSAIMWILWIRNVTSAGHSERLSVSKVTNTQNKLKSEDQKVVFGFIDRNNEVCWPHRGEWLQDVNKAMLTWYKAKALVSRTQAKA